MRNQSNVLFSLIIPTRSRMRLLTNCLHSFFGRASNQDNVEAILLADYDDPVMRNFDEFIFNNTYNIKLVFQRRSNKMIRDYNNYGSQCSVGKYIWMMNDDYEAVNQEWDLIVSHKCEQFLIDKPDRIAYIQVDDSTHTKWGKQDELGCCCPILTKEAVDAQNGVMPGEIDMWGADIFLYYIYKRLPQNRILNLIQDVKVLHHCRHNGTVAPDEVAQHVEGISQKGVLTEQEIAYYVKILSERLK